MSIKSGMTAARKQGLPVSPVQIGPRLGKFYFNTQGHKVYGEPPMHLIAGKKVPEHIFKGNTVQIHVEDQGWQLGKVVKVFPTKGTVHVELHRNGDIAEAHFHHEQVRPNGPAVPPPFPKETHSKAAPPAHVAVGKHVKISTIDGMPGTHVATVLKVTKTTAIVELGDGTHVKASFHELKPSTTPTGILSAHLKPGGKAMWESTYSMPLPAAHVSPAAEYKPSTPHVPPLHNMTSGDLNSKSFITRVAAEATARGIVLRAQADAAPHIDLHAEAITTSRKDVPWTEHQKNAISRWSNSQYKQMRAADAGLDKYVLEKGGASYPVEEWMKKGASVLRNFVDKHSSLQDGVVYRGVKVTTEQLHELMGQTHLREATYASMSRSASLSRSFASPSPPDHGVIFRMKGARGVNIEKNNMGEYEVLSSGKQSFKVTGVHKASSKTNAISRYIIDLEAV